ncbi:glycosyltransferase [Helicobacter cholecystus]|nr:glycosyltransferase family 2 protein [Helicobacter cholecystus]VEJ24465.1 glycosyltransferase [Helicobacter cholecystus]
MQDSPFLSVILPTYNRKACITRMIDSILKQSFTDFELIIIDDGSTDNTLEMLNQAYNDKRISIIKKTQWWCFKCEKSRDHFGSRKISYFC